MDRSSFSLKRQFGGILEKVRKMLKWNEQEDNGISDNEFSSSNYVSLVGMCGAAEEIMRRQRISNQGN